jgi:hypothetical protein
MSKPCPSCYCVYIKERCGRDVYKGGVEERCRDFGRRLTNSQSFVHLVAVCVYI